MIEQLAKYRNYEDNRLIQRFTVVMAGICSPYCRRLALIASAFMVIVVTAIKFERADFVKLNQGLIACRQSESNVYPVQLVIWCNFMSVGIIIISSSSSKSCDDKTRSDAAWRFIAEIFKTTHQLCQHLAWSELADCQVPTHAAPPVLRNINFCFLSHNEAVL